MLEQQPDSLVEVVRARARSSGDTTAFIWLEAGEGDGEADEVILSYGEIDRRARAVAQRLISADLRGHRALLIYPPGPEYLVAFLGCLYAEVVAVPVYPPDPARMARTLARLVSIVDDSRADVALCTAPLLGMAELAFGLAPRLRELTWIATDDLPAGIEAGYAAPRIAPGALAFLQYTSGSTGAPKGVELTHANLLHNERMIQRAFRHDASTRIVGWLPLYHDMGLIGNALQPLFVGAPCVLMSPLAFLQRPMRWLAAISRYRGTLSGGPNFAYELCARKATDADVRGLDLSCWRIAFNGAEPIRHDTLARFAARFAASGFDPRAVFPCYGLAEATLIVSGGVPGAGATTAAFDRAALERGVAEPSAGGAPLVSAGAPLPEQEVAIVDPEARVRLAEGGIGEIWVRGGSVARGYFGRPDESHETFGARLATGEGPFLRTGDLGFVREGQLFVAGRRKDLIIIRGRNVHPQDVERSLEGVDRALRPGCAAAFSVDAGGDEQLVVVHELDARSTAADAEALLPRIRSAIALDHDLEVHAIALVRAGTIAKTSSGKIQRRAVRDDFLAGRLAVIAADRRAVTADAAYVAPATPLEGELAVLWADVLGVSRVGRDDDFFALGGQSLLAGQLVVRIRERHGVDVPLRALFEAPVLRAFAARLAAARDAAPLAGPIAGSVAGSIAPATRDVRPDGTIVASCSIAQRALWVADRVTPGAPTYNLSAAFRVRGALDRAGFERALAALVARHEALRTRFSVVHGEPVQVIAPRGELAVRSIDVTMVPGAQRTARAQQLARDEARRAFDLGTAPLLRAAVIALDREDHVLCLTVHHIIADGWSIELLVRDLARAARGESLAAPAVPYAAYAAWQRARLDGRWLGEQIASWRRVLAGAPDRIELPADRPRPAQPTQRGGTVQRALPAGTWARIEAASRREGVTPFMFLLAVYGVLLHRYSGQSDLVIGSPVANRTRRELEDTVGYFVNLLPIRIDVAACPSVRALLGAVRAACLDAFERAEVPFETLVEELVDAQQLARGLAGAPLVQCVFTLREDDKQELVLPGVRVERLAVDTGAAAFDLVLSVVRDRGALAAVIEYSAELFDPAAIERMLESYERLLLAALDDAARRITALPLLPERADQTARLVAAWNPAAVEGAHGAVERELPHPSSTAAHWMIEDRADETPDAPAVLDGDLVLSYGELDAYATRVADALRGVPAEAIVAIVMDRSAEFLTAMLGAWKAGAAYVPLNPRHPRAQLEEVLGQTGSPVILTDAAHAELAGSLAASTAARVVEVARPRPGLRRERRRRVRGEPPARALAYVIFTSGSTGRPKGAMIEHAGMLNHMLAEARVMGLGRADVVAQIATQTFDVSIWQFVTGLLVGGRVAIFRDASAWEPRLLLAQMARDGVTMVETVPTHLRLILEELEAHPGRHDLSALRWMMVNGEALDPELCRRWFAIGPQIPMINAYGPTECSDDTTNLVLREPPRRPWRHVPIHGTLANTEVYILDPELAPVPVGVAGELYIGGLGVGRGYLNDPEKTASAFLPHPLPGRAGERIYRTGDLVRFTSAAEIEFLGRADQQVKIRGFRIELGEVERALAGHPAVRACVVVVREDRPGDRRLVGYAVHHAGRPATAGALIDHLRAQLPEHMVPAAVVLLDELPLLPNGKVDRKQLPAPGTADELDAPDHVEPRTRTEAQLAAIWCELLGVSRVSATASFFDLGGHSLLAVQLLWRVRACFEVDVPVAALFEAATLEALAARIDATTAGGERAALPALEPAALAGPAPLSFAQERLWFLDQLEPESAFYNVSGAFALDGELDAAALAGAFREIVQRHDSLRTRFVAVDGEPRQEVVAGIELAVAIEDLASLEPAARDARAQQVIGEIGRAPFALDVAPLFRVHLLRLASHRHVMVLAMHHIVADGLSVDVLIDELQLLYPAMLAGEPSPLPDLAIQYVDFAVWQRRALTDAVLADRITGWQRALAGAPLVLELPTDRPRPAIQRFRGAIARHTVPAELSHAVRALAQREGATLFMTLLAAFAVVVHRYTGEPDFLIGVPLAGRDHPALAHLVGFFVNSLPLRCRVTGQATFHEVIAAVRAQTVEAFGRDVPLERLIDKLQPPRDIGRSPLFQVMFMVQTDALHAIALPGLTLTPIPIETGTAKYDLSLIITDAAGGFVVELEYNTDLFDAATMARLAAHYEAALAAACARPAEPIGELPLLGPAELATQLVAWNRTERGYPLAPLHRLFEAQVARTPDAVAVAFEGNELAYGELDRLANRLARRLRARGVAPGVPVAVIAERSLELVIALFAIVKAGGAYVPIDPHVPRDRVQLLLASAAAPVLLVQPAWQSLVAEAGGDALLLERSAIAAIDESDAVLDGGAGLDDLCYILFTSGSTGRPNGVMNTHRAVANNLLWMQDQYALTAADRVAQKTPFGFDVSVWELFWPVLVGARIVIARPEGHKDPHYLARWFAEQRITVAQFVPSMLQIFLAEVDVAACRDLRHLRTVLCIGEALPTALAARCHGALGAELHNLYGPTEAAISVTAWQSTGDRPDEQEIVQEIVSIGRPMANVRTYVLDERLQPVPVGVAGELYLAGTCLARGYHRDPALTADRFTPDPFATAPGERMYRTGDRVRYRADGRIDFLGRVDHQIKLHGMRIEPGEVEGALRAHPAIRDAVVALHGGRLVAYLVGAPALSAAELRGHLQPVLPAPMIPSAFVYLDALPLTPNGKLDRKQLPAPDPRADDGSGGAPATEHERIVAEIWSELLGTGNPGRDADFFARGGHSLLATQLVSRLRARLGIELPLRTIFEAPTLRELAARVAAEARPRAPAMARAPRGGVLPLSAMQEYLWFLERFDGASAFNNISVGVRIEGALELAALRASLDELVRRHEALRTSFHERGGTPMQRIADTGGIELRVVDLRGLAADDRERELHALASRDAATVTNLGGPLARALLVQLGDRLAALVVTLHHIIADRWSLEVLVRELLAIYAARGAAVPEPVFHMVDVAHWQRAFAGSPAFAEQLAYWKGRLAGPLPAIELPIDRPRPPVQRFAGALHRFELAAEATAALRELSRRHAATLHMTMLAVFGTLLHRYGHAQDDLVIGVPIAGRHRLELEAVVGMLVNTLVVRLDASGAPSFAELLARVRTATLEAQAHQDVPFGALVEAIQPPRDPSRSPIFQVMFDFHPAAARRYAGGGLVLESFEIDGGTAKLDLALEIEDAGDGLRAQLEYSTDLFDAATIARMEQHLRAIIAGVLGDADQPIARIPLLSPAEYRLVTGGHPVRRWDSPALFPALFESQVERSPDATAVIDGTVSLSYRELDGRASQVARALIDRGISTHGVVGVLAERSAGYLVALLGILTSGAAYVPLDPTLPLARLRSIAAASGCAAVIADARHLGLASELAAPAITLELDALWRPGVAGERPRIAGSPRDLAYLIFTSGSTGAPKGAMVEHAGMVNHLWAKVTDLAYGPREVVAQVATQSFDVSIWQFLSALITGGTTAVFRDDAAWEPAPLLAQLQRDRVTVFETVPSHMRFLLDALEREPGRWDLSALRWFIVNGEALAPELCERWYRRYPEIPLINAYGPTECSDDVTHYHVPRTLQASGQHVPIHGTLPNVQIYVVDAQIQPVPFGVPGELCVGGVAVGRGYIADPARTATAFIPDPFASAPGARLYRTGDLVRRRADGAIDFLGRSDHQLKIRGFRIELGEIEHVLAQHPAVRQAVALAHGDRIVAYVVLHAPASAGELAAVVRERLAAYMVPSSFVFTQAIPLLANGKIDRRALAALGAGEPARDEELAAPIGPVETAVAAIWARVLDVGVGRDANFFELGGHSLLALQVLARVRDELGVEIPVRTLFDHPTIAAFARAISEAVPAPRRAAPRLVRRHEPAGHPHPLAPVQLPEWYMHELEPDSPFYNVCLGNLLFEGELDIPRLLRAFELLTERHAVLRTTFGYVDGKPVQRVAAAGAALRRDDVYVDRRALAEDEVRPEIQRLARAYSGVRLDFAHGPSFRLKLVEFSGNRFLFVFVIHHILWDETSTMNFAGELSELYNALRAGRAPVLPALEVDYTDYAAWMDEAIRTGAFEAERAYWLRQFAELPPPLELPLDHPRPALQTFNGGEVGAWLRPALVAALEAYGKQRSVTLYMLLMAIFEVQLHRITGQRDFVVGTPIANRADPSLEPLLGLFATAMPMRFRIRDGMTFEELLAETRQTAIEAIENYRYPSVLAIQEINPAADPSRNRLFSVMYGLQNNKTRLLQGLQFDGVTLSYLDDVVLAESETSKFDLTVIVDQFGDEINLRFNYNSDLFERATAQRMLDQLIALTEQVVRQPDWPVSRYQILGSDDARVLAAANATDAEFDQTASLPSVFAERARLDPGAVAVEIGARRVSYGELDAAVETAARHLVARGLGPDERIGLAFEPSLELVCAMLAVHRAGASYVPLPPEYPAERRRQIARATGLGIVLGPPGAARDGLEAAAWLSIDEGSGEAPAAALPRVDPRALAYTVFTSGTTGEPKGIEIEHRGVVNLIASTQRDYALGPSDAVLLVTSYGFDASVLDVFWPLAAGARLVVPSHADLRDVAAIGRLVAEHRVTVLQCVPLVLDALVDARARGRIPELPSLRLVICGGSYLTRALAERFHAVFGCRLANHYGPTEVTVDATRFACEQRFDGALVPIGRPVANARAYVLDADHAPVPLGTVGEIFVASVGLARGYLGDPALTAARFLPDPFATLPGARMYRTGDLGRYSADGQLSFVGRVDKQVKIRGNRVELEEIERQLSAHPEVRRCLVRAVRDGEALLAYVELRAAAVAIEGASDGVTGDYRMFSLAQRPELKAAMDAMHVESWPEFFLGDSVMRSYWPRLAGELPAYQVVIVDRDDRPLAAGNAAPIRWDGSLSDLPAGWDDGIARVFAERGRGVVPDTLMLLTGIVAPQAQGRGLATVILRAFKQLARSHRLARVMVAVRPTGKSEHPEQDFAQWCAARRPDGTARDNWIRAHERVGGRALRVVRCSQRITAPIRDWERWAGRRFPSSGDYRVPGALETVHIDLERGVGEYEDPCLWMEHPHCPEDPPAAPVIDGAQLREHLRATLPDYMVPEHIRFVAAMPLLESGKIDERALPPLELARPVREHVPPATRTQRRLAVVWRAVLGVDDIGIYDDFFELGGHSIKAVELLVRLSDELGASLSLRTLFKNPTIDALARVIDLHPEVASS